MTRGLFTLEQDGVQYIRTSVNLALTELAYDNKCV